MAETILSPDQGYPAAGVLTDLFAVTDEKRSVISSIVVCNQASSPTTFRVAVAIAGAADSRKQYLYYDERIDENRTFVITIGPTLGPEDVVRVSSANGQVSFNAFRTELG